MKVIKLVPLLVMVAACQEKTPDPVGRSISRVDVSKVQSGTGRPIDAETMKTRRIAGTWRGLSQGRTIEATFGSDGTVSMQVSDAKGLNDAVTGTWKWTGGTLMGETTGATGELGRYARWSGAFPTDEAMNISGADGAIMVVRRR